MTRSSAARKTAKLTPTIKKTCQGSGQPTIIWHTPGMHLWKCGQIPWCCCCRLRLAEWVLGYHPELCFQTEPSGSPGIYCNPLSCLDDAYKSHAQLATSLTLLWVHCIVRLLHVLHVQQPIRSACVEQANPLSHLHCATGANGSVLAWGNVTHLKVLQKQLDKAQQRMWQWCSPVCRVYHQFLSLYFHVWGADLTPKVFLPWSPQSHALQHGGSYLTLWWDIWLPISPCPEDRCPADVFF